MSSLFLATRIASLVQWIGAAQEGLLDTLGAGHQAKLTHAAASWKTWDERPAKFGFAPGNAAAEGHVDRCRLNSDDSLGS